MMLTGLCVAATLVYTGLTPSASRDGLPNPERGWRFEIGVGIHESDPYKFTHVRDQWPFPRFKADGVTVSQAYCYLSQFHDSPVSDGKIAALEASFARARREGYKFLLRFAYDYDPYLKPTPSKEQILKHIAQLKPVVRRNIDVIYCLQTGWVGAWGEFHSAASGVDKDPKAVGEIVKATLDMLPPERSTMMRLVEYKLTALGAMGESTNEVTAATAWSQKPTARIGFFNDGTLANWWDGGTFRTEPYADEDQWAFERVRREGLYTPVDGELFWTGQYSHPVFACGMRAIDRFSKQHYTTFSLVHGHSLLDQSPRPWTIDGWKVTPVTPDELRFFGIDFDTAYFQGVPSRTAYEFIRDHLGYRLALKSADLPETKGDLRLVLHNYGFAPLVNPRELILVAVSADGRVREIPTDFDCRRAMPGKDVEVTVPIARQPGERLALWLPDATPSLRLRPDYAVRLATAMPTEDLGGRRLHFLEEPTFGGGSVVARRIFRAARQTRGNTNIRIVQPIDEASWLWSAEDTAAGAKARAITHDEQLGSDVSNVFVFRKRFEVKPGDGPLVIDVSADERFYLTCDGAFVARGPNRADVENWQYQTYSIDLPAGRHELRAVVTRLGEHAPLAQLSYRGGFVLKANGVYDAQLTTGKAAWEIGRFGGMRPNGSDNGVWGTGSQFVVEGAGPFAVEPKVWTKPVVVRGPASARIEDAGCGGRTPGWMLFPSQLPDQTETVVRPGAFRAATTAAKWRANHVFTQEEAKAPVVADFNRLLRGEAKEIVIPAKTRLQLAWHLGRYICAYPEAVLSKGRGARFSWTFTESSRNASDKRKGDRAEIVGKYLEGYGETYLADGRERAVFSSPWFRCGLWSRLDIETADEPLVIRDLRLVESRYPLEMESSFESPDDPSLKGIRTICARAMQMCCHEMLFDCPYYEQQMYPGDTRVQLLVLSALSRDERIVKRAMEIFDLGARDDGQCPFNWPTRGTQEGFTYTLCYLAMFGDYAMNHADFAWLRARLPGMRKSMAGCELYENAEGLVEETPGWNFMDWTTEWNASSVPNSRAGQDCNSFANLFWLLAMQSAATTERALGNELQAQYWERKAARLKAAIVAAFWDEKRGLVSDTKAKKTFSEHSQALAILTDCLPPEKRDICFRHLVEDEDLARTTVYFNYYLFEAYFKMGRADLFLKRLDLWRGYVAKHITTLSEMPDTPQVEGRSDCHAWGAHPIWFMQTGLAGIRSAAPGFAKVLVAPQPGTLKSLKARHPHPQGWIEVDLTFDGKVARGTVKTPVAGTFVFGGKTAVLHPGENRLQ